MHSARTRCSGSTRVRRCFMNDIFSSAFYPGLCSGIKRDATHGRRVRNSSQQVIHRPLSRGRNSKNRFAKLIARLCLTLTLILALSPSFRAYDPAPRRRAVGTFKAGRARSCVYRRVHKRVHYSCTRIRI